MRGVLFKGEGSNEIALNIFIITVSRRATDHGAILKNASGIEKC